MKPFYHLFVVLLIFVGFPACRITGCQSQEGQASCGGNGVQNPEVSKIELLDTGSMLIDRVTGKPSEWAKDKFARLSIVRNGEEREFVITKALFSKYLLSYNYYDYAAMTDVQRDTTINDIVYFTVSFCIPDTDEVAFFSMGINKDGGIDIVEWDFLEVDGSIGCYYHPDLRAASYPGETFPPEDPETVIARDYENMISKEMHALFVDLSKNLICPDSVMVNSGEWESLPEPVGFRGENFQRFQIHFDEAEFLGLGKYKIKAHIKYNGDVLTAEGTAKIIKVGLWDCSPKYFEGDAEGVKAFEPGYIVLKCKLKDSADCLYDGELKCSYLQNNFTYLYNATRTNNYMTGFSEFSGRWISKDRESYESCNWGIYNIPESENLFIDSDSAGAEPSINPLFLDNGWSNYPEDRNEKYW